ncbi:MAG: DUF6544 family protein [Anaerolineaceae bacterium]|jgi:hypothetical protein
MNILSLIELGVGVFVAYLIIFRVGFLFKPKVHKPELEPIDPPEMIPLPGNLPYPVRRYLQMSFGDQVPLPATAIAWGLGKRIGRNFGRLGPLWMPSYWALYLIPGKEFVYRLTVTWYGRRMLQGGDELRQGYGRFIMNKDRLENANINKSEWIMMWLYTILTAPSAILADANNTWEAVDDQTARLSVPYQNVERWDFTLLFDSQTGQLTGVDTLRVASRDGKKIPYQIRMGGHDKLGPGTLPGFMKAAWENDFYIMNNLSGVRYNVNISEMMEEGASESNHMPPAAPEAEQTEEPEEQAEPETEEQAQLKEGQKEPKE